VNIVTLSYDESRSIFKELYVQYIASLQTLFEVVLKGYVKSWKTVY